MWFQETQRGGGWGSQECVFSVGVERREEGSTMKINNEARRSGTGIRHPDVYRPRLPVRQESTDNSGEEV